MAAQGGRTRIGFYLLAILIAGFAGFLRWQAVMRLPVDYDELAYLPVAFRYQEMINGGRWSELIHFQETAEHPLFNKLLFAVDLSIRQPKEPDWNVLDVGRPIPTDAQSAFYGPRLISAVGGTLQVLVITLVNPIAGLLLALDTYHVKYSAQVYLEGVPGLMAVLAVFFFERGLPNKKPEGHQEPPVLQWRWLLLSAATLAFAAAGKYLYGIVGFVLVAFLILRTRSMRATALYCFATLCIFVAADPYLWPNPPMRLWDSLSYHWRYAHSEHVVSSAMPWYAQIVYLLQSAPTSWHPAVFYTGVVDLIILPLSLVGLPRTWKERPIWVAWMGFGLLLLLLWPTKWPQYTLLVLPPISVCAGIGIERIGRRLWSKSRFYKKQ